MRSERTVGFEGSEPGPGPSGRREGSGDGREAARPLGPCPRGQPRDESLPQPLAELGNQLARQARRLGGRYPGRPAVLTSVRDSAAGPAVARERTRSGRSRWQGGPAAGLALVAALVALVAFRPGELSSPLTQVDPRGPEVPREARPDAWADRQPAPDPPRRAAAPREPAAGYRAPGLSGEPAFLRRVSGPELEALIDLWDADPVASRKISI